MKTLLLIAMTITTVAGSVVAEAQIPVADTQGPFRFELEQANGPRGGKKYSGVIQSSRRR